MLQLFKEFLNDVGIGEKPANRFSENDYRLAAAALLIHVMSIDGKETSAELDKLHELLKRQFELDDDAAAELITAATEADREAVDLYGFTSLINRSLDEEGRLRIVRMMWEMVYADGRMNEFEDNVVWRASDLLGISQRDRVELRREVAETSKSRDDA
ncbi:TerB family tellurite resistance protein [Pseudorhodoplanes sp.]|uniref:tellurite resistance TerB family protein n=1 Tax=Pseudorhodoplanes sp. TaxID=1934341 RepID=UPI002D1336A8|nr:TerB family tellurite resistance protein [Pseudorhodoplanes sp.]HWV53005.1 TerB family tellurite resistance protein [Pseudorhodoplanes sp.]